MLRNNNFTDIQHNYNTNIPVGPGTINSFGVKTYKQVININSLFRDNYTNTSATNYIVRLPHTIKKIISLQLFNYNFPELNFNISNHNNNNNFVIIRDISSIPTSFNIKIPDGIYTVTNTGELTNKIQTAINNYSDISDINIVIDTLSFRTTLSSSSSIPFQLDFSFETAQENNRDCSTVVVSNITRGDHLTLGWILGFRGDYIKNINARQNDKTQFPSTRMSNHYFSCMKTHVKDMRDINFTYMDPSGYSYTSEGLLDLTGERYLLLSVDDYQHNHNTVYMSPFKEQSLLTNNILAKLTDNKDYSLSFPPRIYFGPTNIDRLGITIYDAFGRIYNTNYGDYSIELLLEYVYDGS